MLLTTMNKRQFVLEALTCLMNARSIEKGPVSSDPFAEAIRKIDEKTIRDQTEEWLGQLYDVLDKEDFYVGRKGVKY